MAELLSALQPVANVQSYAEFVNSHGTGMVNPEVFYSKQLLDTIRDGADTYQYFRYADAMPIQEKADKLTVRRWAPLQAHTVPLAEGLPPRSDKGSVEKYEMEAFQYGRYMEFTDKVSFKVVDPVIAHYSAEYSIVAVETLDLLAQDTLLMCAQKHYAGLKANTSEMTIADCKPTIADLRLIGLSLKKQKVKPRSNGKFHALISSDFIYDMFDDEYVQNYMKINQTTGNMYDNGALTPMFGFEFYEVSNCPTSGMFYNEVGKRVLPIYKVFESGDKLGEKTYTEADADTLGYVYGELVESDLPYHASTNASGTWYTESGYVKDSRTGMDASYIPEQLKWKIPEGWAELKVEHTIILGADALARTGLTGEDNAKMYAKPLGSTGVLDPIDQRQSIGFKINSVGFGSTRLEAIVDYMNIPTQLNTL